MTVFKIMSRAQWLDLMQSGHWFGSDDDRRDGFVHLSNADQVAGTLQRHFAGSQDLLLIGFDAAALGAELRYEPSRGGQLFPHLYGPLTLAAALSVEPLTATR